MKTNTYKLKDISLNICDGVHNTVIDDENGDCLLLSAKNLQQGKVVFDGTDRKINRELCNKLKKRTKLEKNDIAITTVGANVGDIAIVGDGSENYEFQRSVGLIKPDKNIADPTFLFFLLGTKSFNYYFHVIATGSAQPCLFLGTLNEIKVQIPSIHIQQKIANILSLYNEAIENNNKRIKLLEQMSQNLYKEWFVRFRFPGWQNAEFENGIPKGWKVEKLGKFCFVTDGTHDTPVQVEDGIPLVTGKAVRNGEIDFSVPYNISKEDHEKIKRRSAIKTGDILFSNIGTVGNSCLVNYERDFSVKNMIILKPNKEYESQYLYQLIINDSTQNLFQNQTNGSSQQFIGLDFMRKFKILIPKQNIMEQFGKIENSFSQEIILLRNKNKNLAKQRDLLLPRLMSGKLEVR